MFMISASILLENVEGMELKFREEIDQHLIDQQSLPLSREFQ